MRFFISILVCVCFVSCYSPRYVYSPATQNIPVLNKKNDYKIAAYLSGASKLLSFGNNYARGLDVQAAYAFSDHFGIMLNEYLRWEKNGGANDFYVADDAVIKYKRNATEFGVGYFTNLNRENNIKLQLFAGAAFGESDMNETSMQQNVTAKHFHYSKVSKIFFQPAIVYSKTPNFSAGLSSRFSSVKFSKIRTDYSTIELSNYLLDSLATSSIFFWEPAMSYTFGFKGLNNIKFEVQTAFTVLINRRFVDYRSSNFALGVLLNFEKHKKEKEQSKN